VRASRGQREVGGKVEPIEEADLVQRIRAVARGINVRALLLAAALTAAVGLCPA
jgi:hypothetical protein